MSLFLINNSITNKQGLYSNKQIALRCMKKRNLLNKDSLSFGKSLKSKPNENELLTRLKANINEIMTLCSISNLLNWDQKTFGMPEEAIKERSKQSSLMQVLINNKLNSPEFGKLLSELNKKTTSEKLNDIDKAIIREWNEKFCDYKKIPEFMIKDEAQLLTESNKVWKEARNNDDYESFKPYLEKLINHYRIKADLLAKDNSYNALLNIYQPGFDSKKLDSLFVNLKSEIIPLLNKIRKAKSANSNTYPSFMYRKINTEKMKQFCKLVLNDMGFDFSKGKIGESVHPFSIGIDSPNDTRIAIRKEDAEEITIKKAMNILASAMHEGGHSLVEQNADKNLQGTGLTGLTIGLHESQSRLWEQIVGRSKSFWKHYFPILQETFPNELKDVTLEEFYKAINNVEPSPIRVEADEVTYNLHIMLRYEIEKLLFDANKENAKQVFDNLPEIWNSKMEKYVGYKPKNDKEGLLQDVHWSSGHIGKFSTYTIGNLASVQFYNQAKKEIPDLEKQIEQGNLKVLKNWLTEKIYKNGQIYKPEEIIQRITAEPLNSEYFVSYLKDKYADIYYLDKEIN